MSCCDYHKNHCPECGKHHKTKRQVEKCFDSVNIRKAILLGTRGDDPETSPIAKLHKEMWDYKESF